MIFKCETQEGALFLLDFLILELKKFNVDLEIIGKEAEKALLEKKARELFATKKKDFEEFMNLLDNGVHLDTKVFPL